MILNSNLMTLRLGSADERLAYTTSLSLDYGYSVIDVTTRDTNGFREVIADHRSFDITFDGLFAVTIADKLFNTYFQPGDRVSFRVIAFGFSFIGEGILTSLNFTAGTDSAAQYSGVITSNGDLITEVPIVNDTICYDNEPLAFDSELICGPRIDL